MPIDQRSALGRQKLFRLSVGAAVATLLVGMCSLTATLHVVASGAPDDLWNLPWVGPQPVPKIAYTLGGLGVWLWNAIAIAIFARLMMRKNAATRAFTVGLMVLNITVLYVVWDSTRQFSEMGRIDREARVIAEEGMGPADAGPYRVQRQQLADSLAVLTEPNNSRPSQTVLRIRRGAAAVQSEAAAAEAVGDGVRAAALQDDIIAALRAEAIGAKISELDEIILKIETAPRTSAAAAARARVTESGGFLSDVSEFLDNARHLIFATMADLILWLGFQVYVMLREAELERDREASLREASLKVVQGAADLSSTHHTLQKSDEIAAELALARKEHEEQMAAAISEDAARAAKDVRLRKDRRERKGLPEATPAELAELDAANTVDQ